MASTALARNSGSHVASSASRHLGALARRERAAERDQIVAGIDARGDRADVVAERLAVAQPDRARQLVDLSAGVVDVVLARDRQAHPGEQVRERVAEHRAAAVADVQRSGRVGRAVLDIDRSALGRGRRRRSPLPARSAIGICAAPEVVRQVQIDEAGLRDLAPRRPWAAPRSRAASSIGQLHRRAPGGLGQDQRRVGGGIAVARIARRLDRDPLDRQRRRQARRPPARPRSPRARRARISANGFISRGRSG